MQKNILVVVSIILLLLPVFAMAGDDISTDAISDQKIKEDVGSNVSFSDFNLSLGLKLWHIDQSFNIDEEKVNFSGLLYGPSLLLIYKHKFFSEIKYLVGKPTASDYDDEGLKKTDLDIYFGYSMHPRSSVFFGYKNVKNDVANNYYGEMNFNGLLVGLDANYPLENSGFILLGTLEFGHLQGEIKAGDSEWDGWEDASDTVNEYSIEIGAAYIFPPPFRFSMNGAFKWQSFRGGELDAKSSGFIFGVNYYF